MRILVVGDWHSELHEEAVYGALTALGHEVLRFPWHQYFTRPGGRRSLLYPVYRAQYKYMWGPVVDRLNADLAALVEASRPDAVFIYRGTHVQAQTLARMRRAVPDAVLVGYNNDDPFSPLYPGWMWRHFKAGIPLYDLVLAYRHRNLAELEAAGAKRVGLLRSWFMPQRNHPVELDSEQRASFGSDVVFVGHYEDDGRIEYLEEIARRGWNLRLFGPPRDWAAPLAKSSLLSGHLPLSFVSGERYNLALAGAKVALCFFSRLNRDTYTRRCFEIPASGTVMLSSYSDDVAGLFAPDREAVYFQSVPEMAGKLERLLGDDAWRQGIAAAGLARVWQDGHDVQSRMLSVVEQVKDIASARRSP
jgi:spore maturation protein CgeB